MGTHAKLSASGSHKWAACPASPRVEQAEQESTSIWAAEGTVAHFVASETLEGRPLGLGSTVYITAGGDATLYPDASGYAYKFVLDSTMLGHVAEYVQNIKEFAGSDGALFVEQALDISVVTGEEGARGTADAVVLRGSELQVHDLKYGRNAVDVTDNKQLMLYAYAAYETYCAFGEFDQVLIAIHQPRVGSGAPSTQTLTIAELEEHIQGLRTAAEVALYVLTNEEEGFDPFLYATPGGHCSDNYCKARATCPALVGAVEQATEEASGFFAAEAGGEDYLSRLGNLAAKVPMVQDWCKSVMDKLFTEVLEKKQSVPGFKVVMGREGNRAWKDEKVTSQVLKSLRVPKQVAYEEVLLSPTKLDAKYKEGVISKGAWPKIEECIVRAAGKPTVAPLTDKRPAIELAKEDLSDGFEV